MKLFDNPVSPYVFKVRATLYEKGIEFEQHEIWRQSQRAELLRVNPRGEVPALQDGGTVIYDSRIICEYLEEKHSRLPLLPADEAGRARCRALELICDTQIDACVFVLGVLRIFRPELAERFPEPLAKISDVLRKHYANLDAELDGKEYLGGVFSRADIALFPHLAAAEFMGQAVGDEYRNLANWLARSKERPSLQRAFQEALDGYTRFQNEAEAFFDNGRLHWRSDRIEMALRVGLGPWLLEDLAAGGAFLPPVP